MISSVATENSFWDSQNFHWKSKINFIKFENRGIEKTKFQRKVLNRKLFNSFDFIIDLLLRVMKVKDNSCFLSRKKIAINCRIQRYFTILFRKYFFSTQSTHGIVSFSIKRLYDVANVETTLWKAKISISVPCISFLNRQSRISVSIFYFQGWYHESLYNLWGKNGLKFFSENSNDEFVKMLTKNGA